MGVAAEGGAMVAGIGLLDWVAVGRTGVALTTTTGRCVGVDDGAFGSPPNTVRMVPKIMLNATNPLMIQKSIWLLFFFTFELFKRSPPRLWIGGELYHRK